MPEESRLDRIERLTEQNTVAIGQLTADLRVGFTKTLEMFGELTIEIRKANVGTNAAIIATNAEIAAANAEMRAGFRMVAEAIKEMAEAQSMMLHSQENLNKTLDRLAQLWGQSPN